MLRNLKKRKKIEYIVIGMIIGCMIGFFLGLGLTEWWV